MARVVVITKNQTDSIETTRIYGPYETTGIAKAMLNRGGLGWLGPLDDLVDGWVEECEPVVWHRVDTESGL